MADQGVVPTLPRKANFLQRVRWGIWLLIIVLLAVAFGLPYRGWSSYTRTKNQGWTSLGPYTGEVDDFVIDSMGQFWLLKQSTIEVYSPDGRQIKEIKTNTDQFDRFPVLAVDLNGQPWIGGEHGGVRTLQSDGQWVDYEPEMQSGIQAIEQMAVDGQGNVWVNTGALNGLSKIDSRSAQRTYRPAVTQFASGSVNTMAVDAQKRLWVIYNDRLMRLEPDGTWTTVAVIGEALTQHRIFLAFDRRGNPWICAGASVMSLATDGKWTTYSPAGEMRLQNYAGFIALAVDANDRVWAGSAYDGLYQLDRLATWKKFTEDNSGISYGSVDEVFADAQGKVWVGMSSGVATVDPNLSPPSSDTLKQSFERDVQQSSALAFGLALLALLLFLGMQPGSLQPLNLLKFALAFGIWYAVHGLWILVVNGFHGEALLAIPFVLAPMAWLAYIVVNLGAVVLLWVPKLRWLALGVLSATIIQVLAGLLIGQNAAESLDFWTRIFFIFVR